VRPRLSRDLFIYGFGEIVTKAFGLITLPIYTRLFNAAEFGTLSVALTVAGFILAVLALGGDSAFIRYFLATTDARERRVLTSTWIGFLAIWSFIATLLLLPFSGQIALVATSQAGAALPIALALLLAPVRLVNLMCGQVLRNEFRAGAYISLNVAALALMVMASLFGVIVLELGIVGVLLGTLVAEIGMLPVRILSARHMLGWEFSPAALRGLLAYGLPLVPTSLAYWVFTTSDRVMLSNLSTLAQVGLYSVAASVISIAMIAVTALGQGWNPHAIRAFEEDQQIAGRLFARMFTYILAAFGLLAIGMSAFAPELIGLVAGREFVGAAAAIAPLSVGMIAYATTQVTAGGITLAKRTGYLAVYAWLAAIINVALNFALIPRLGMVGAAWATSIAYVALTATYLVTSRRLWPFDYEARRAGILVAILAAGLFVASLLGDSGLVGVVPLPVAAAAKAALVGGVVVAMFALGGLDQADLIRMRSTLTGLWTGRATGGLR
jgi:O-antigen/teichoic acid export membrane protein